MNATLQHVIVYNGPGAWKVGAYWDEYVVTLRNAGTAQQTITRALLTDFRGSPIATGNQPWTLEQASRANTRRITATLGNVVHVGAGVILPLTLAPGQEITGSLFFPVTPGPRQLQMQITDQSLADDVELPLPGLAMLHLETLPVSESFLPRPVPRAGKWRLTLKLDADVPGAEIRADGHRIGWAPCEFEVVVDAQGRLLEDLKLTAHDPTRRSAPGYQRGLTLDAGAVPPAKIEFTSRIVKQVQFEPTAPDSNR